VWSTAAVLKKIKTNEIFSSRAEKYTGFAREACKSSALLSSLQQQNHLKHTVSKHTMKEFEKVTNLLRKSREDLSDTTLSPESFRCSYCLERRIPSREKLVNPFLSGGSPKIRQKNTRPSH